MKIALVAITFFSAGFLIACVLAHDEIFRLRCELLKAKGHIRELTEWNAALAKALNRAFNRGPNHFEDVEHAEPDDDIPIDRSDPDWWRKV